VIQRKDLIRVLYSNDFKNKVFIYKLDDSVAEGYIVYEDRDNYTIRENLASANELSISKDKVNFISKKKVVPTVIEKKVEVEKVVEVERINEVPAEEKLRVFGMDWGIGISLPVFFGNTVNFNTGTSTTVPLPSGLMIIWGLRLNIFFDFRFNILDWLSTGVESGVNIFPNIYNLLGGGFSSTSGSPMVMPDFFLDVPIRGFVRFGTKKFYGQIFGGYYLGVFPMVTFLSKYAYYERGGELGGRVNFWGFYMEISYIFENKEALNFGHMRAGLGYTGRIF